jgi:hypothetical protein
VKCRVGAEEEVRPPVAPRMGTIAGQGWRYRQARFTPYLVKEYLEQEKGEKVICSSWEAVSPVSLNGFPSLLRIAFPRFSTI